MISIRVWKGYHPRREAYTPVNNCQVVSNEIRSRYITPEVQAMVEQLERQRGRLSEYDRKRLYMDMSPLWERSEAIKEQILAEMRESKASDRKTPLTTQHRGPNTIVRPAKDKSEEMIRVLAKIQNLVDRMFTKRDHGFEQLDRTEYKKQGEKVV